MCLPRARGSGMTRCALQLSSAVSGQARREDFNGTKDSWKSRRLADRRHRTSRIRNAFRERGSGMKRCALKLSSAVPEQARREDLNGTTDSWKSGRLADRRHRTSRIEMPSAPRRVWYETVRAETFERSFGTSATRGFAWKSGFLKKLTSCR